LKRVRRELFAKPGQELRQELEEAWGIFQGGAEPIHNVDEIPFPPTMDFGIEGTMTANDMKSYLISDFETISPRQIPFTVSDAPGWSTKRRT
jgi:hypothetical protein